MKSEEQIKSKLEEFKKDRASDGISFSDIACDVLEWVLRDEQTN